MSADTEALERAIDRLEHNLSFQMQRCTHALISALCAHAKAVKATQNYALTDQLDMLNHYAELIDPYGTPASTPTTQPQGDPND